MKETFTLVATAAAGLEAVVGRELRELGQEDGSGVCTVLFREIFGCHLNSCREVS